MRISDWSSDVCSSDLLAGVALADPVADAGGLGDAAAHVGDRHAAHQRVVGEAVDQEGETGAAAPLVAISLEAAAEGVAGTGVVGPGRPPGRPKTPDLRSEAGRVGKECDSTGKARGA